MVERIRRIKEEVIGIVSLLGSLYLSLCFFTHNLKDPVLFFRTTEPPEPVRNLGGIIGAYISGWLIILLGFASFIIPVLIIAFGIKRLIGKEGHKIYLLGGILFVVSSSLLLSLLSFTFTITLEQYPDGIGGLIGRGIAHLAHQLLSLPGAYIFSITLFLSSLILLSPVSITTLALSRKQKPEERKKDIEEILESIEESKQGTEEIVPKQQVMQEITVSKPAAIRPRKRGGYELPSLELLNAYDSSSVRPSRDELMTGSTLIKQKLEDFDVEGDIKQVHPGPVVTMYEFEPAPGVKINRVVSLSDDLALSLKAPSVRISPKIGRDV